MEGRPGFVISPWCGEAKCEADIKAETQATIRNIPKGYERGAGQAVHQVRQAGERVGVVRKGVLELAEAGGGHPAVSPRARGPAKCCSRIRAARSGRARTTAPGPPERAVHRRRAAARCRQARIRRGDGLGAVGRLSVARDAEAAERQGHPRVGRGIGFRCREREEQSVLDGVAAEVGADGGVSRRSIARGGFRSSRRALKILKGQAPFLDRLLALLGLLEV